MWNRKTNQQNKEVKNGNEIERKKESTKKEKEHTKNCETSENMGVQCNSFLYRIYFFLFIFFSFFHFFIFLQNVIGSAASRTCTDVIDIDFLHHAIRLYSWQIRSNMKPHDMRYAAINERIQNKNISMYGK